MEKIFIQQYPGSFQNSVGPERKMSLDEIDWKEIEIYCESGGEDSPLIVETPWRSDRMER